MPDSVRPCRNYVELHIILLYFPAFCDTILILINFTAENSRWNINIFAKVFPAKSPQIHPTISEFAETQYVQVKQTESECVYITRRGESDALLRMFAESTGAVFQEQMGGVYIFSDDDSEWMLESEIYWKNYTVWVVPAFSNDDTTQNYEQVSHLLTLNVKVIEMVEDEDNLFLVEALESYKDEIKQGDTISVAADSTEVSDILETYQEHNSFRIYFPKIDDTSDGISVTCLDVVQYDSSGEIIQQVE